MIDSVPRVAYLRSCPAAPARAGGKTEEAISPHISGTVIATKAFPVPAKMSPIFGGLTNLDAASVKGQMAQRSVSSKIARPESARPIQRALWQPIRAALRTLRPELHLLHRVRCSLKALKLEQAGSRTPQSFGLKMFQNLQ